MKASSQICQGLTPVNFPKTFKFFNESLPDTLSQDITGFGLTMEPTSLLLSKRRSLIKYVLEYPLWMNDPSSVIYQRIALLEYEMLPLTADFDVGQNSSLQTRVTSIVTDIFRAKTEWQRTPGHQNTGVS